jgi:hypothetical protein
MGIEMAQVCVCDYVDCEAVWLPSDGLIPERCARCKRPNWNREQEDEEMGDGYIYIMHNPSTELHKIGQSRDPERRRKQIGEKVTLVAAYSVKDALSSEQALHRHFSEQRVGGEWFRLSGEDLIWIDSLDLYHPSLNGWISAAVTCRCHPPGFTSGGRWKDWDRTFTKQHPAVRDSANIDGEATAPRVKPQPTVAALIGAQRQAHDAKTCRVYQCGLCAVSGK